MFGRNRRTTIDVNVSLVSLEVDEIKRKLETIMSNQELFDSYAAKIHEQNTQIKAAVAVILSEIGKLQRAAEAPLDTAKMDAAISQLTAAVDTVEAIPTPAAEEPVLPVELPVEELAEPAPESKLFAEETEVVSDDLVPVETEDEDE